MSKLHSAIERHLSRGRHDLKRQVQRYLDWLASPPGQAATPANAQRRFTLLRLRFNVVLSDLDIFSEALWQQNLEFAQERADTIKKHCMGCEIAGACHGACVLSGIDANNQLNKGGCAYLRRLWRRLTAHLLDRNEGMPSKTAHPVRLSELVATGSGEPAPAETAE